MGEPSDQGENGTIETVGGSKWSNLDETIYAGKTPIHHCPSFRDAQT